MTIYFYDGGVMLCNTIEFCYEGLIVDEYRIVPCEDVVRITSEEVPQKIKCYKKEVKT